jgi:hypothetical protein
MADLLYSRNFETILKQLITPNAIVGLALRVLGEEVEIGYKEAIENYEIVRQFVFDTFPKLLQLKFEACDTAQDKRYKVFVNIVISIYGNSAIENRENQKYVDLGTNIQIKLTIFFVVYFEIMYDIFENEDIDRPIVELMRFYKLPNQQS